MTLITPLGLSMTQCPLWGGQAKGLSVVILTGVGTGQWGGCGTSASFRVGGWIWRQNVLSPHFDVTWNAAFISHFIKCWTRSICLSKGCRVRDSDVYGPGRSRWPWVESWLSHFSLVCPRATVSSLWAFLCIKWGIITAPFTILLWRWKGEMNSKAFLNPRTWMGAWRSVSHWSRVRVKADWWKRKWLDFGIREPWDCPSLKAAWQAA